ncbi:hypothetical protein DV495_004074 [Geotrichum candidum]|nr:hypothetical protein DV495_004074 [Geotrichum candidum]
MDDSTIPFDFDDCNAFLNSLDDNTSASTVKYQKGFNQATTMNDFNAWDINDNNNATTLAQTNFIVNPNDIDPSSFFANNINFYNNDSSSNSPISSPSITSDSDSSNTLTDAFLFNNNTIDSVMAFPNSIDASHINQTAYPITPPYPSANSFDPETSPNDLADTFNYSAISSPQLPVKSEPISPEFQHQVATDPLVTDSKKRLPKQPKKSKASKKSPSQKLGADTKSNKVTKPKKEKTSHNMIEKRYRTNINDKILALRDCVPSLRCIVTGGPKGEEDLEGLSPASKLNKATVLTKATEYILHLQKRNAELMKNLAELRHGPGSMPDSCIDSNSSPLLTSSPTSSDSSSPVMSNMVAQAYPTNNSGNFTSKAMMLSMAGLLGAGLVNDNNLQGLSALPVFAFLPTSTIDVSSVLFSFKVMLILGTLLYLLSPSLFDSPPSKDQKQQTMSVSDDSEVEQSLRDLRRQAWVANSRTLSLPSEAISSQIFSFFQSIAQCFTLNMMGSDGYDILGRAFNSETLASQRVSLSRAIEAQLCGGDASITRSRLFFTFIKSFMLPPTASRYLSQAVHINILCNGHSFIKLLVPYITQYFLMQARKTLKHETPSDEHRTPSYIRAFLFSSKQESSPDTYQRLYNVAFGLPISNRCSTGSMDEGYLSIVTDKSLRSVGDVVAALYTNSLVHEVLVSVLEKNEIDFRKLELCSDLAPPCSVVGRRVAIVESLLLGPKDASYAKKAMDMLKEELEQQAWVSHKLNGDSNTILPTVQEQPLVQDELEEELSDSSSIMSDYTVMSESETDSLSTEREEEFTFLSSAVKTNTTPFAVSQDSRLGIRCSLILCYLERNMNAHAFQLVQNVEINKLENICLLGFVAMWKVLCEMHERKYTANRHKLEDLSAVARVWLGGNAGTKEGVSLGRLRDLVGESVKINKFFGGYDNEMDEGYGTQ